jgi:hypothetical protein
MKRLVCATALLLPLSLPPAFAEGVTITGSNGGSIAKTRDCTREAGFAECATGTTYTTPGGEIATKSRLRTTVPGESSTDITFADPDGTSKTRTRIIRWGN